MYYIIGVAVCILLLPYFKYTRSVETKKRVEVEWEEKRFLPPTEPLESVMSYWESTPKQPNVHHIDSITWNDLSMNEVFQKLNYTQTSIGSEYLYNQLHTIQLENQDANEPLYELMEQDHELRNKLIYILRKLGKENYSNSSSFFYKNYGNITHIWFYILCGFLPVASIITAFFNLKVGIGALVLSMVLNILIYYNKKLHLDSSLYETSYIAGIIRAGKRLAKVKDVAFQPYATGIRKCIKPIRNLLHFEKVISLGKGKGELDGLFEYIRIIFLLDYISYYFMISMISKYKKEYEMLWKTIGEIDAGIAVAFYRHSTEGYCTPDFTEKEEVTFTDLYHPLINKPVKNSSEILKQTLITGSNASGKSTFMKAVAINAILAQTIHTVHAKSWSMKPSYVLSSMAIQDNVIDGDSYFKAEIKSLKRIIKKIESSVPCLVFIDEILRGTNTVERIAASASMMDWLTKHPGMIMIASHDIELTTIAGFDNYHFRETVQDDGVYFDYQIHKGPSTTKNAIKLLEVMDYPSSVTALANSLAEEFDEKGEWRFPAETTR